jgi:transcriptional regulator with XRE-family HTH domain
MQHEVATRLGVHIESVKNWERGATSPTIKQTPKIIEFLGYDPAPLPGTILEQIRNARRRLGLTQKGMAKIIGVDPVTVYRWEKGLSVLSAEKLQCLQGLLQDRLSTTPR